MSMETAVELPDRVRRVFEGRTWIGIEELADALESDRHTLTNHIEAGDLTFHQIGTGAKRPHRRFTLGDVAGFLTRQARQRIPCQSPKPRDSTTSTSGAEVIGFRDQLAQRASAEQSPSSKPKSRKPK